ncbi:hypothetical protein COB28_04430 [Candidatus Dependentiae bacterium]|nr:MAG: hypothetical protein COB28_04430 [Candidatus Dependentiae bacterium]
MKIVQQIIKILSLFFSFSTLLCCALPAFLGFLGFGAALAGIISVFPFLITMSRIKHWLFFIGGFLLAINGYFLFFRKSNVSCAISDNQLKNSECGIAYQWNKIFFFLSAIMLCVGFFMAYCALPIFKFIGIL